MASDETKSHIIQQLFSIKRQAIFERSALLITLQYLLTGQWPSAGQLGGTNLLKYKSRKIFIFGVTTSTTL